MTNSFPCCGLQYARLPCPSLSHRVCSNSCPLSGWCHPTISSSVTPFSCCPQSFPASETFPMSRFFSSVGQSAGASASASVLPGSLSILLFSSVVHSLFGTRDWFCGKQTRDWDGEQLQDDSNALQLLCTLFLLLLHHCCLRSSGIRSWGLGTPNLVSVVVSSIFQSFYLFPRSLSCHLIDLFFLIVVCLVMNAYFFKFSEEKK